MTYDPPCRQPVTNAEKIWPYDEYYIGDKDEDNRKSGHGTHHWSGAESQERYCGQLLRDCLHGLGTYRYRHRGQTDLGLTYEGYYFNNYKYGYGQTSYPNGRVFRGLYHSNFRWGPGIESEVMVCENVGLWRGRQLMRLTWKPGPHSVAPDLMSTPIGSNIVAKHRTILVTTTKIIGEINPALELLKQYGAPPLAAAQNWIELYPKNCTDPNSQLYHSDFFQRAYYKNKMVMLEEADLNPQEDESESDAPVPTTSPEKFYAWNNNKMMVHMMKHCYLHDHQRKECISEISLSKILNGPRGYFKQPAQHELDCRTMLLASYLGHITNIAQLINEYDVNPNVSDIAGNSAIMYAACGYQPDVIHFLVEAGARINDCNDACCTPLGAVMLVYACTQRYVPYSKMLHAILPPATVTAHAGTEEIISEWQIKRNENSAAHNTLQKSSSNKTLKGTAGNANRKNSLGGKKTEMHLPKENKNDSERKSHGTSETLTFTEDKRLYYTLVHAYHVKINELLSQTGGSPLIPYIFEANDMVKEVDIADAEELKKSGDKKDANKGAVKASKMTMQSTLLTEVYAEAEELKKEEQLKKILRTIEGLLLDGADPRCVNCPEPALAIAIASHCPELVHLMIKYGADVKQEHPHPFGYSLLDTAISGPLTDKNLEIIRMLLESGAKADHRLLVIDPLITDPNDLNILGPTLLHVVLAKKCPDTDGDDDVREQIVELLLQHGCDPLAQYNGRSAMDWAMSKSLTIFDIFIESPHTDLNAIINASNQTILVKMFYMPFCKTIPVAERILMLTNLMLYGADPLRKCQNGDSQYENLFVYTKKVMAEITKPKPASPTGASAKKGKPPPKTKPETKPKTAAVSVSSKSSAKAGVVTDEAGDYKQVVGMVANATRDLYIRWLQARLMKELINVVDKYKHRHWNIILREYKNGKRCGLWLNPPRCLEIWDILKTTKKRMYNDNKVLKYVLYIVHYHFNKRMKILRERQLSTQAKTAIELEVAFFIREHNSRDSQRAPPRPYAMPELTPEKEISKYNICFECALPLEDAKIPCGSCELVNFCSFECIGSNIERFDCHPCSNYLRNKYFPTPESSDTGAASPTTAANVPA